MSSRARVLQFGEVDGAARAGFAFGGGGADAQIATARRFPRDVASFREDACQLVGLDEATARACVYAVPRGGRAIAGPSVRFAEIILSCWGNAAASARIVSDDEQFVVARGVFHDLQRNTRITCDTQRRVAGPDGSRYGEDVVVATRQAACSMALRDAVLRGIPQALWKPVYDEALVIIAGDAATLAARLQALAAHFARLGVRRQQLAGAVGVRQFDDIQAAGYVALEGLANAIRDGNATVESAFHARTQSDGTRVRKSELNDPPDAAAGNPGGQEGSAP